MMNKKRKDKDFVKGDNFTEKLSNDLKDLYEHTNVPQSINADMLSAKMKYALSENARRRHYVRRLVPVFAAFVLVISLIPVSLFAMKHTFEVNGAKNTSAAQSRDVFSARALTTSDISSDMSIYDYLRKIISADQLEADKLNEDVHEPYTLEQPIKLESDFKSLENASNGSDLLCEDENYFYYIQNKSQQTLTQSLLIIDKNSYDMVSSVQLEPGTYNEMYLKGSYLIIIADNNNDYVSVSTSDSDYDRIFKDEASTVITVYDVSSPQNPKISRSFSQQGELMMTNITDSKIITLSKKKVTADLTDKNTPLELYVPFVCDSQGTPVPVNDISVLTTSRKNTYCTVSVFDLNNPDSQAVVKSFLGDITDYYVGESGLYFSYTNSDFKTVIERIPFDEHSSNSVVLEETLSEEMFFNESDGKVFVTSGRNASYGYEGIMYVLDSENLSQYSKFTAQTGSEISWVTYFDDTVYWLPKNGFSSIIVLDISDTQNIKLVNRVTMSGSMEYIYKLSDRLMLGVGYSNQSSNENKITLSLFNIDDRHNPYFINGVSLGNGQSFSDIYYDFRALKSYEYDNFALIGCPINLFTASDSALLFEENLNFCGIYLFTATQNGLKNIIALGHTDSEGVYHQINRWAVVDDKVFTFSDRKMTVNSVSNGLKIAETTFQ